MPRAPKSKNGTKTAPASWDSVSNQIMANTLLTQKELGNSSENGFKPSAWQRVVTALHTHNNGGGPKTASAAKSRWQRVCIISCSTKSCVSDWWPHSSDSSRRHLVLSRTSRGSRDGHGARHVVLPMSMRMPGMSLLPYVAYCSLLSAFYFH